MGHHDHLSIEEREDVMPLARQHKGVREIARTIGRDKSTVSREPARNSSATGAAPHYGASTARRKHERRRGRRHRQSLTCDPERRAPVAAKLGDERWSPEQIEGRIGEERPDLAAGDAMTCRAVWSGGLDCALPGRRKMSRTPRRRGRGRRRRGSQERRGRIATAHELSERPPVCLIASYLRVGTAVGILDQEKATRRTACTAQSSASWQSRPTSSST